MPMPAAPPGNLPGVEARAEEDEEKERADAELRQLPDHALLKKKLLTEKSIKSGLAGRLPDGGKKLRASLDAVRRELSRRKLLRETGAEADEEKEIRAVAEARQLPDDALPLLEKEARSEKAIKAGLPDGGKKKLHGSLDAVLREPEAGAEDDEEKERADAAEVREKKLRDENVIEAGLVGRLPEGGKRPRETLDTTSPELARRKLLSEGPHRPGGDVGGPGERAQDQKGCEVFVPSRGTESSGTGPCVQMLMAVVPTESLFSDEMGAEEDKEKERANDEVRQLPDHALQEKKLRTEKLIKAGLVDRLPDGGKKLYASHDAICRELTRRKPRSEAPHPLGCSSGGDTAPVARAQDEKGCERIVQSRCAKSSGTGPRAYVSRRVTLCSVLKAIKGSEASFRSVGCGVPDRFAVEVYAEAPWPSIPGNVHHLKAMSGLCDSVEAAEESAANNLVAILQKEYGVIVDDFNYAALCMEREKKKAYCAAAKAFESG